MKLFFLFLSIILFLNPSSHAQEIMGELDWQKNNNMSFNPRYAFRSDMFIRKERPRSLFLRLSDDYNRFFRKSFQKENVSRLLGIGISTGALMAFDHESWEDTRKLYRKSRTAYEIAEFGEYIGDGKFSLMISGAFAAYGFLWKDDRTLRTARNIFESLIASGLMVQVLKRVTGRESPDSYSKKGGHWHFFPNLREYEKRQSRYYAYPSGHITTITSTLTVLANSYPEIKWLKPVSYGVIGLVGFGLVSKNMHWYSDLPLGIFLGYSIASIIAPEKKDNSLYDFIKIDKNLEIAPYIGTLSSGVCAKFGL